MKDQPDQQAWATAVLLIPAWSIVVGYIAFVILFYYLPYKPHPVQDLVYGIAGSLPFLFQMTYVHAFYVIARRKLGQSTWRPRLQLAGLVVALGLVVLAQNLIDTDAGPSSLWFWLMIPITLVAVLAIFWWVGRSAGRLSTAERELLRLAPGTHGFLTFYGFLLMPLTAWHFQKRAVRLLSA